MSASSPRHILGSFRSTNEPWRAGACANYLHDERTHADRLRVYTFNRNFDMLAFHKFTHGNSLVAFGLSAFDVHGLQSSCNVKANVVADFLKAVQDGYLCVLSRWIGGRSCSACLTQCDLPGWRTRITTPSMLLTWHRRCTCSSCRLSLTR